MKRLAFLCFLILTLPIDAAGGQVENQAPPETVDQTPPAPPPVDPRFESPRETITTFLESVDRFIETESPDALDTAISTFDGLAGEELQAGEKTVLGMLEIFNKIENVRPWTLPSATQIEGLTEWDFFPRPDISRHDRLKRDTENLRITLQRQEDGSWRFTRESAEAIPEFDRALIKVRAIFGRGEIDGGLSQRIRDFVPDSLETNTFLTVEAWQWIGLLLFIFVGLLLDLVVRTTLRSVWVGVIRRRGSEPDRKMLKRSVRPFGLLLASLLWYYSILLLDLPLTPEKILRTAARFVFMLSAVLAAYRIADLIGEFFSAKASTTSTRFDDLLIPLLRKSAKILVTAMGVVYIADSLKIEILPLLTGLGIGGLAFAFAAKDTVENFFGSIAVIADRPFEVGDWVVINDTEGTVEELGFRSTRIRTFYNSLITVPNSTLVRTSVDNYGKRRYRRFTCQLGLTYDTPPEKIEAFCSGIREIVERHPYTRKDYYHAWLNKFGPSSLDVLVYIFHECPDWSTELRERHRFMLDLLRLADRLGVEFAFPTQTLHLSRDTPVDRPTFDTPPRTAEHRAVVTGKRAAREVLREQPWLEGDKPTPVAFTTGDALQQADLFADLEDEPNVGTETTES